MIDEVDCVGLGLACADVCMALDRGTKGRETNGFSRSALEAIEQLTVYVKPAEMHLVHNLLMYHAFDGRTAAEIQGKIVKRGKRNAITRLLRARKDEKSIATWRLELTGILQVFNVGPVRFTHDHR